MSRAKRIMWPILWVSATTFAYHLLNMALFSDIITPERINTFGWGKYVAVNISVGFFLYCLGWAVHKRICDWRELRHQRDSHQFPVKILTMSDPCGLMSEKLRCNKDGCNGFIARAKDQKNRRGTFCLKCNRNVDEKKELSGLAHLQARLDFSE